ncbi:hypothetical protein [Megasphaera sp.]|uniref:hypothetical protein n=1 Tax=Megasphaera sp. TaxID=2023260 RepID=UPI00257B5A27|nr:hypothetical protein [Megasphaera sp.]
MYDKVVIEIMPNEYTETLYKNDGTIAKSITWKRKNGILTSDKSWDDVFWDEEANDIQFDYEDLYDALNSDDIFDIQKALYELTYL